MKVSLFEISYKKKWTFSPYSNFVYIYLYNDKIINITLLFLPPFFEILRPIVVPFIHDHHLMLQHDNAWPNVARICTQFLEAENIPVLAWPADSPDMSPIEHVWDALDQWYDSVFQFLPISSNFAQPLKRSGPTFHRPQSTTWSTLLHCVRQMAIRSWKDHV